MDIKILTPGCCTRHALYGRVETVLESAGIDASVEQVDDLEEVMQYGMMSTPALVIDGEVRVKGHVPSAEEIAELLRSS